MNKVILPFSWLHRAWIVSLKVVTCRGWVQTQSGSKGGQWDTDRVARNQLNYEVCGCRILHLATIVGQVHQRNRAGDPEIYHKYDILTKRAKLENRERHNWERDWQGRELPEVGCSDLKGPGIIKQPIVRVHLELICE
jgi:hypothetical protein